MKYFIINSNKGTDKIEAKITLVNKLEIKIIAIIKKIVCCPLILSTKNLKKIKL